jgi:DNA replication protein DnaC
MTEKFDLDRITNKLRLADQYSEQLRRLKAVGSSTECIEAAVAGSIRNLEGSGQKSFVIYGEPQSGKTEMMICLTAKLLDAGHRFIVHRLNDSVDLLDQNIGRFHGSRLSPAAQNFVEILDPGVNTKVGQYVVFCKKNANDLRKLT